MPVSPANTTILSVVVPMHNEADNVGEFYARVKGVLEQINEPWEIVCVNDGSSDATLAQLAALRHIDTRVNRTNVPESISFPRTCRGVLGSTGLVQ